MDNKEKMAVLSSMILKWSNIGLATGVWLLISTGLQAQTPFYYYENGIRVDVQRADDVTLIEPVDKKTSTTISKDAVANGFKIESYRDKYIKINSAPNTLATRKFSSIKSVSGAQVQSKILLVHGKYQSGDDLKSAMVLNPRIACKLKLGGDINAICKAYGLAVIEKVSYGKDTYYLQCVNNDNSLNSLLIANKLVESGEVEWACPELEKPSSPRFVPNDPLYSTQWHLKNNGTNTISGIAGHDISVEPAWDSVKGDGIVVAVFDSGVQIAHPDLSPNILTDAGWNFINNTSDPSPSTSGSPSTSDPDNHGTACAGLIAAKGNNGIGVSGSAPNALLIGLRKSMSSSVDAIDANGLSWNADPVKTPNVYVNSNSWGPNDTGKGYDSPGPLVLQAIDYGINSGRNGKGVIYTWAGGNGRASKDNVNRDGYANHPGVIAVGATLSNGVVSTYSEPGAALLISAPGGSNSLSQDLISTTDRLGSFGYSSTGDYTSAFNGTSSACPIVAGVVALILQSNPNLTYRDVKMILAKSARINDATSSGWKTNGAGLKFNHDYGFGTVNAAAAVPLASTWVNLPPRQPVIELSDVNPQNIPDNNATGVSKNFSVSAPSNFAVEYVELQTNISHTYRGDLDISLTSPSGMVSQLQNVSTSDGNGNISFWKYRSNACLGESPSGNWTFTVKDLGNLDTGIVQSATLRIYGYLLPVSAVESWALYQ